MPATKRERITGLGYDPNFGGIDLSGCPSAQDWPKDASFIDDRFAPMDTTGSGHGSAGLKKFIAEQAAEGEGASVVHVGDNAFRVFSKDGQWHADGEVGGKRHRYSAPDRDALLGKLMKLAARRDTIKKLSELQLLEVARIAGTGDRVAAINRYLEYAVPQALADKYDDPNEIVNDPALRTFMDSACEYVWLNSRLDATDSEDWQDYKAQFVGQRPVSCALLDHAWSEFSSSRNRLVFAPSVKEEPEPQPVAADIENMTDAEIDATYKGVARSFAQSGRR